MKPAGIGMMAGGDLIMSKETENIAWQAVAGLLVFLQLVTLAFCGYIVSQIDDQRRCLSSLGERVAIVESYYHMKSNN